ncbi:MAG: restriction endonuclease [Patescibacteria group bacterium]|nr:restriction endonuclease [Patescibacteria group bacterium]
MSYYLIRMGEGSKYIEEGCTNNFIAIGWNEISNIKDLGSTEAIKNELSKTSYKYSPSQIAAQAGQLSRFALEMANGDFVISPKGGGKYVVGVIGDYYFENDPQGICKYKHRRKIEWKKSILKEDMSTNLAYAMGATLTIYSLNKYSKELDSLISGDVYTPADKPQRIRDLVREGLYELNGKEFEEFVRHLLEIIGFQAETTQYVGDNGIDVNGILDAEGLANVVLRIQVKRVRGSISNQQVLALRGTLKQEEHGCFITLSSFTSSAIEEAHSIGKVPIKLIDGEDLSVIVLKHYEEIDDRYKEIFGIRRKKDFNIEDQFETNTYQEDEIQNKVFFDKNKRSNYKWDTLLCAAKDDGFKEAFLEKKSWWAVRLSSKAIPLIKYIAMYQVAPVSKITYYGKVSAIKPFKESNKYIIYLEGEPIKLKNPVPLGKNRYLKPQGPKYTELNKILISKSLDDLFNK